MDKEALSSPLGRRILVNVGVIVGLFLMTTVAISVLTPATKAPIPSDVVKESANTVDDKRTKANDGPIEKEKSPFENGVKSNSKDVLKHTDFSDAEWASIVSRLKQDGRISKDEEADEYYWPLHTMKVIYMDSGLAKPTTNQLFNGIDILTAGGFQGLTPSQVDDRLRRIAYAARTTGIPVITSKNFDKMEHGIKD